MSDLLLTQQYCERCDAPSELMPAHAEGGVELAMWPCACGHWNHVVYVNFIKENFERSRKAVLTKEEPTE